MVISPTPIEPGIPRVFVDTSVIFAGFASDRGASYAVLMLASLGLLRLVIAPYLIDEIERNLTKKLPDVLERYDTFKMQVQWEILPDPPDEAVIPWLRIVPMKDAPVIAAAVAAKPYCLLTLDTHHLIKPFETQHTPPLPIKRPGELIQEIRISLSQNLR